MHVLDYLYKRLDEVCLVQGGELVAVFLCSFFFFFPLLLLTSLIGLLKIFGPGGRISHVIANLCWKFIAICREFGFMVV